MTVAKAFPLQVDVYNIVVAAVAAENLEIFDYAPSNPPDEFIRLDGFNVSDKSLKNKERGRHSFEVHIFLRPVSGSVVHRGQERPKAIMALIHADLNDASLQGGRVSFESMSVDRDNDGTTQHGRLRYSITIS